MLEVSSAALEVIGTMVQGHLTPEVRVEIDMVLQDQAFLANASWRPTQRAEMVRALLEVLPSQMEHPEVVGREICVSFDRYLEHMKRDAELWRALQARRRGRWWRRLWRHATGLLDRRR